MGSENKSKHKEIIYLYICAYIEANIYPSVFMTQILL